MSNVLKTDAGHGETNVEFHVKCGISKLLSWLLDILSIVSFICVLLLFKSATLTITVTITITITITIIITFSFTSTLT